MTSARTFRLAIAACAALFFVEAATLALRVTPLWDIPDEVGHLAYVESIALHHEVPSPERSFIPEQIVRSWKPGQPLAGPVWNWASTHPPLYYLLAAPVRAAAERLVSRPELRWRLTRLPNALFGSLALCLFFEVFLAAFEAPALAFAAAASIGVIPMWLHMASGIDNDILVGLFGALAALFWVRFERGGLKTDAAAMAMALALAGATKLTAIPVALALAARSFFRLPGSSPRRLAGAGAILAIALSLPLIWIGRGRDRLAVSAERAETAAAHPAGPLRFLRTEPVIDHTFKNFLGLIGWTGTGRGDVRWFQIDGAYLLPFLLLTAALLSATAISCARGRPRLLAPAVGIVFVAAFLILFPTLTGVGLVKRAVYSLLLAVPLFGLAALKRDLPPREGIRRGALLVFLVFSAFDLANSWQAYAGSGQMRATHGRYFFVLLAFLPPAFLPPQPRRNQEKIGRLALLVTAVLAGDAALFFLLRVIPFYAAR
jgi:hypothetical protein